MTTTSEGTEVAKPDLVTLTIDDVEVSVPKGTLVIRAAEQIGVQIPRFCDHPLLEPVGACRQCLVEVPDAGNGRPMPKPQASCTIPVAPGMVVRTQATSEVADKAQQGIMEFLLINHPLDCPVCDKGGECPLQNQAMSNGRGESRFWEDGGVKRVYPKPIKLSDQVLLDRERCVLCARCTRFSEQIAGDPFIALTERGAWQQVGIFDPELDSAPQALTETGQPFSSYFSGNTIQICPVGALTSADYRFRSRPFDLVSTPSVAEHDACGAAIRVDHRRGKVMRRLSGNDPEVNEEWISDKDRFAFRYDVQPDRLTHPLVRDPATGELRTAAWTEAFAVAARGLAAADSVGVLTGGRLSAENSYAYAKFARVALHTNDVDFRSRAHRPEEADFLAAHVALSQTTYADLDAAGSVLLVALEPEDEAATLFLRLRKANRTKRLPIWSVAPFTSPGLYKMGGSLIPATPGTECEVVAGLAQDHDVALDARSVVLVGERAAEVPGLLAAVFDLAGTTGARLAWVPRRAGDRGAVETGALPNLLPGGRPVLDASARADLAAAWGVDSLPDWPGRDANAIIAAAASGELRGLVVGGVDPADLPDPAVAESALNKAFVVSLELRESAVTRAADVVFPVASHHQQSGSYVTWEGRLRTFETVLHDPGVLPDIRVLDGIATEMGRPIHLRKPAEVHHEMAEVGPWDGPRAGFETPAYAGSSTSGDVAYGGSSTSGDAARTGSSTGAHAGSSAGAGAGHRGGGLVLASWKQLLDDGRMQDGEAHLRATARAPRVLVSAAMLDGLGVSEGDPVTLVGPRGSVTLPVGTADLAEDTVWAPASAAGVPVRHLVGPAGCRVSLTPGGKGLEL